MQRFLNGNFGKYCLFKISYVQYNKHSINSLATCYLFNIISSAMQHIPVIIIIFLMNQKNNILEKWKKILKLKLKNKYLGQKYFFLETLIDYFYPNLGCSILFFLFILTILLLGFLVKREYVEFFNFSTLLSLFLFFFLDYVLLD